MNEPFATDSLPEENIFQDQQSWLQTVWCPLFGGFPKLEYAGVRKVVPDDSTLEKAYQRAVCIARLQKKIDWFISEQERETVEIPAAYGSER